MTVPVLGQLSVTDNDNPLNIEQLTTSNLKGTGVFDMLMRAVKLHLIDEFNNNRLTGAEYTSVLSQAIPAILSQSVQYITNHANEKLIGAQIGLTRQKIVTELANTDDSIPEGLGYNATPAILGLVEGKKAIDLLQKDLVASQILSDKAKRDHTGQQIVSELSQTDNSLTQAIVAGYGFNSADVVTGAMEGANQKSIAEGMYAEQKVVTELGNTSETKPSTLGLDTATVIGGIVAEQRGLTLNQKEKAGEETILLAQKAITELAQTSDVLPTNTKALTIVGATQGSIARQQALFTAQTDGFARSAEQKLMSMMLETWNVSATVGNATPNIDNQLHDASLGAVVALAKTGVGLTGVTPLP